jgi:ABC-type Fe2+-enterobactin transport system substrate-binding protein
MILIPSEFAPTVEVSPGTNTLTSTPAGSVATFTVTGTLGRI